MKELSKSIPRRQRDPNFLTRYFVGDGVDIGGRPDPLSLYKELFPLIKNIKIWDLDDGDAQFMESVPVNHFDFVHSSHCLEHLQDPYEGLNNWLRVTKPGGFVVVTIPDEDLYEQGVFPSTWNRDHKKTFTICKRKSWSSQSINVIDLASSLGSQAIIEKIELLTGSYRYCLPRFDQTSTPIGECAIELIIRKAYATEIESGGLVRNQTQPPDNLIAHYNQYLDDYTQMKSGNNTTEPFKNKSPL